VIQTLEPKPQNLELCWTLGAREVLKVLPVASLVSQQPTLAALLGSSRCAQELSAAVIRSVEAPLPKKSSLSKFASGPAALNSAHLIFFSSFWQALLPPLQRSPFILRTTTYSPSLDFVQQFQLVSSAFQLNIYDSSLQTMRLLLPFSISLSFIGFAYASPSNILPKRELENGVSFVLVGESFQP